MLRKLAATYRARAVSEPERSEVFLEIAKDMEKHADLIDAQRVKTRLPFTK